MVTLPPVLVTWMPPRPRSSGVPFPVSATVASGRRGGEGLAGDGVVVAEGDVAPGVLDERAALGDVHDLLLELGGLVTGFAERDGHPVRDPVLHALQVAADVHLLEERRLVVGAEFADRHLGALGQRVGVSRGEQSPAVAERAPDRDQGLPGGARGLAQGPDGLAEVVVVPIAVGDPVGVPEERLHRPEHMRCHLQHQHPALRVDADEDGGDDLLAPPADPDAQEVPTALAALLDGSGAVRLEAFRGVRGGAPGGQSVDRQEDDLVDLQLAQPVPYGRPDLRRTVRRGDAQRLHQRDDVPHDGAVVERFGRRALQVLAGAQFDGERPGLVRLTGSAERVVGPVHDEPRVLLDADPVAQAAGPRALGLLGRVGALVGEALPGQLLGERAGELTALGGHRPGHEERHGDGDPHLQRADAPHLLGGETHRELVELPGLGELGDRAEELPARVVVGEEEEEQEQGGLEEGDPPVPAHQEGEDDPVCGGGGGPAADPAGEAEDQEGADQEGDQALGERDRDEPERQDADGPAEFDTAGAQGVGEDAARVVAEGGGGEALLVDVQLVDDRVAEAVVEVRAGAEQPGRLAGGG
ncbi:LEPR-XLL domain-containing protein [Streptomyces sp. NPDC057101]|uniref:LEPR-XLL domain-containing protein n=1 Tax=Streptomyces sp. NPDC057101 TaxID=3346020 RepID=UPI00362F39B9